MIEWLYLYFYFCCSTSKKRYFLTYSKEKSSKVQLSNNHAFRKISQFVFASLITRGHSTFQKSKHFLQKAIPEPKIKKKFYLWYPAVIFEKSVCVREFISESSSCVSCVLLVVALVLVGQHANKDKYPQTLQATSRASQS